MNTHPEVIQSLMNMNERRNKLMRANAKKFGIPQDEFKLEDELGSFLIDNSNLTG